MINFCPPLRVSLRTLFVLVTVMAVWLGYQLNWIRQRREPRELIVEHNGNANVELVVMASAGAEVHFQSAPFSLRILGEDDIRLIGVAPGTSQEKTIKRLFPEAEVGETATLENSPALSIHPS